jgi:hypothetical protein
LAPSTTTTGISSLAKAELIRRLATKDHGKPRAADICDGPSHGLTVIWTVLSPCCQVMVSYEMRGANTLTPPMNCTHGLSLADGVSASHPKADMCSATSDVR